MNHIKQSWRMSHAWNRIVLQINHFWTEEVLPQSKSIDNELVRTWHKTFKVWFETLSKYVPEESKDNHNNLIDAVNFLASIENQNASPV